MSIDATWSRWNGEGLMLSEISVDGYPSPPYIEHAILIHPLGWVIAAYIRDNPYTRDDFTFYGDHIVHRDQLDSDAWNLGHRFPTLDVSMSRLTSPVPSAQTEGVTQEVTP